MCSLETKWGIVSLPWGMLGPEQCRDSKVQAIRCTAQKQGRMNFVMATQKSQLHCERGDMRLTGEHQWAWRGWMRQTVKLDQTKGAAKACTFMLRVTYAGSSPEQQPGGRGQRYAEDSGTSSLLEPWGQKNCSDTNSEKRKEDGGISKWLDILSKGDYIV